MHIYYSVIHLTLPILFPDLCRHQRIRCLGQYVCHHFRADRGLAYLRRLGLVKEYRAVPTEQKFPNWMEAINKTMRKPGCACTREFLN